MDGRAIFFPGDPEREIGAGNALRKDHYLFVYGTLKRGEGGTMHHLIEPYVDFVGEGSVAGRLYRLDGYPGLVRARGTKPRVWGELYRVRQPAPLFRILDAYEGCSKRDPLPHEYRRVETRVTLKDGRAVSAWTYEYIAPLGARPLISSGIWTG